MLRESTTTAEAIIELIRTLPEKEQQVIAKSIVKKSKVPKKPATKKAGKNEKYLAMGELLKKYRGRLPKDYKFDREEANAR